MCLIYNGGIFFLASFYSQNNMPTFCSSFNYFKSVQYFSNSRRESNGYFLGGTEGYQVPFNIIYIIIDVFSRKHFNN